MRRKPVVLALGLAAVVGGGATAALAAGAGSPPRAAVPVARPASVVAPASGPAPTELPPLPKLRPKAVEPAAGRVPVPGRAEAEEPASAPERLPAPTRPASRTRRRPERLQALPRTITTAAPLPTGVAVPPLDAPAAVRAIIEAGNAIARHPYKWGGGHGRWQDDGYDCSGSVSYALAAAGLLDAPLNSTGLMGWGEPGRGRWVTIYANHGHVFMEVAGLRFDTSGARRTGSRWQDDLRGGAGFVARHPPGL